MKLASDQRGRHDAVRHGDRPRTGWWEVALLEERRTLLQWALDAIANLEVNYASVATENAILWERNDIANQEVDRLRERVSPSAADGPGAALSVVRKVRVAFLRRTTKANCHVI